MEANRVDEEPRGADRADVLWEDHGRLETSRQPVQLFKLERLTFQRFDTELEATLCSISIRRADLDVLVVLVSVLLKVNATAVNQCQSRSISCVSA